MRLMTTFFRQYPKQIVLVLTALSLAGLAEGISLSALLPLLNIAVSPASGQPGGSSNAFSESVVGFMSDLGLTPSIGVLLLIILIGLTIKSLLLLTAERQVGYTAARIGTDLRLALLRAIMRTRWEYFLHQPIGKLTNSLATESTRSATAFMNAATVVTFFIQALIYGGIALALSWKATLVSLLFCAIIISITHFLVRMARKAGKRQTKLIRSLLSRLADTLQSVKPLKAMAREHLVSNVLTTETTQINRALERQVMSSALLNASQDMMFAFVIAGGMYVAIEVYGMAFTTVMVLVLALGRMLAHIGKVQKQYQKMTISESAFWSIQDSIQQATLSQENCHGGTAPTLKHAIQMQKVAFSYDQQRMVFEDLDLEFPTGEISLLLGASGAGKTTILDLTIGLLEPHQGQVLVDNIPLSDIDIGRWRSMIGYVPQETLLLHDSIKNNVSLGDPEISELAVQQALEKADLWDFVSQLPEGMHTMAGERGGKLSGGQRQRIMIARALVNNPPLLILDEATSALHGQSETALRETLEKLRGKLTIVAISHSDWLSETADRVYQLENGKIERIEQQTA